MRKELLRKKFERLESSKKKLVDELEQVEEAVLNRKPAADKWSITQICYHLHIAEAQSLGYVKKKMLGADSLKKAGAIAAIRSTFLKWGLRSPVKWKAPAVLGDLPESLDYSTVIQAWNETRGDLQELIESIPDKAIDKKIYRHPRAGRLNLAHMLEFFQNHFDRHLKQINRLKTMHPVMH